MIDAQKVADLAESRLGERYLNVTVPKNNPDWHGPWDCAEFSCWVAYQSVKRLFGCVDNNADPALAEAYSGAWSRDAVNGALIVGDFDTAMITPGMIVMREPPFAGAMGHVCVSDGKGGVIEAAGVAVGVRRGPLQGRLWHHFAKLPGVQYDHPVTPPPVANPLPVLLQYREPWFAHPLVGKVQRALKKAGYHPGPIDNAYGPNTVIAVQAFQRANRLIADGVVGPKTAKKLGVPWPDAL